MGTAFENSMFQLQVLKSLDSSGSWPAQVFTKSRTSHFWLVEDFFSPITILFQQSDGFKFAFPFATPSSYNKDRVWDQISICTPCFHSFWLNISCTFPTCDNPVKASVPLQPSALSPWNQDGGLFLQKLSPKFPSWENVFEVNEGLAILWRRLSPNTGEPHLLHNIFSEWERIRRCEHTLKFILWGWGRGNTFEIAHWFICGLDCCKPWISLRQDTFLRGDPWSVSNVILLCRWSIASSLWTPQSLLCCPAPCTKSPDCLLVFYDLFLFIPGITSQGFKLFLSDLPKAGGRKGEHSRLPNAASGWFVGVWASPEW